LFKATKSQSFGTEDYIRCLGILKELDGNYDCRVIVRVGRNISRGTGTLLSPSDRKLVRSYSEEIVLVLYRLEGLEAQGWDGVPLWVPNIKFPSGKVFYATDWDV